MNYELEELAFSGPTPARADGFSITAHYLKTPKGDALVEISRGGTAIRKFLYPAYKIWNLAAHFDDIVASEIAGDMNGYALAGWTGFTTIMPDPEM